MANKPVKQKVCKWCGDKFTPFQTTQKVCSTMCAIKLGQEKRVKDDKKAHTAKKTAFYTNDRATQLRLAQKAFNAYIRWRDRNEHCISCGRNHDGQYHAGHYRSVGAAPHLRFNQFNNNKQCAPCNNHKSGNISEYRIRLVKKYRIDKVEWLESQNTPAKLSLEDIISIKVYYTNLLRRVK